MLPQSANASKDHYAIIAKNIADQYQYHTKDDKSACAVLDLLCGLCDGFAEIDPNFDLGKFARAVAGNDSNIEWIITGDEDTNTDIITEV